MTKNKFPNRSRSIERLLLVNNGIVRSQQSYIKPFKKILLILKDIERILVEINCGIIPLVHLILCQLLLIKIEVQNVLISSGLFVIYLIHKYMHWKFRNFI
jgi:hypothetical protein